MSAPFAQLRLGQLLVRVAVGLPQLEDADEFRLRVGELRMRGVGRARAVGRAFARVLDAEEAGDRPASRAARRARSRRPACARASRRPAASPSCGRSAVSLRCASTAPSSRSCCQPSATARGSGGSRNGKSSMSPEPQRQHAQDHAGQRGAADFRIGVVRPRLEIGFGIQADSRCPARCARSGPRAGWRWPASIGSICRRSSFCRGL